MNKYDKKYLEEKMADFRAFRDAMEEAGYAELSNKTTPMILLYSMWRR